MSNNGTVSILLNDEQLPFFEDLLIECINHKVMLHLRNPRVVGFDSILFLSVSDSAFTSSVHLLGITDIGQLKTWIEIRRACRLVYEDKGFHLEVHKIVIGEDDRDNSPLAIDAIYLVRDGYSGIWPNDTIPSMFSST